MARIVENEGGIGAPVRPEAPVVEQMPAEPGALDALQKLVRNERIGVDVAAKERQDAAAMHAERVHQRNSQERTSAKWPSTAAAAAMAGLTRCVRPPRP